MKKKIIIFLGILVIIGISISCSFITENNPIYDKALTKDQKEPESILCEIIDQTTIKQTFVTDQDKIDGIQLKFATYSRPCVGNVDVKLYYQDAKKPLATTKIDISKLQDNQFYKIRYDEPIKLKSKKLRLEITGIGTKTGSTITTYGYNAVTPQTQMSYSTGDVIEQTLDLSLLNDIYSVKRMIYLMVSLIAIYFYVIFVLRSIISKK